MPLDFFLNAAKRKQYVLIAGDGVIVLLAFGVGHVLHVLLKRPEVVDLWARLGSPWIVGVAAVHLVCFYVFNLYDLARPLRRGRALLTITLSVAVSVALSASLLFFLGQGGAVNRVVLVLHVPAVVAGLYAWRRVFFRAIRRGTAGRRLAFLGSDPAIPVIARELGRSPLWDYQVVGTFVEDAAEAPVRAGRVLATPAAELRALAEAEQIDTLVVSVSPRPSQEFLEAALALRFGGAEVVDLPTFAGRTSGRIPVFSVTSEWVLAALSPAPGFDLVRNARRAAEFCAAAALALIAAPAFALIALVVKLDSRGPVLFRQQRLGRDEVPFMLYKFRTMVVGAEVGTGPRWAEAADPRITRVGKVLRKTGLDELPQLFNILGGQMSFVGPRPIRRHFAELLADEIPYYRLRFTVKPGVTGWAQIRHDYAGSVEGQRQKFEYELFSLRHSSPVLDLYIVLKTAQKLVMRRVGEVTAEAGTGSGETARPHGGHLDPDLRRAPS